MYHGGLSFYDPGWLWVDALVYFGVPASILLVLSVVGHAVAMRRIPKHLLAVNIGIGATWLALILVSVSILVILDVMRRPDWLPFLTGVH